MHAQPYKVGLDPSHWHLSPKPQLISWMHHRHINEAQIHENIGKNQFYKDSDRKETNTVFIKLIFFPMFSCILSFVDLPMVLPTY